MKGLTKHFVECVFGFGMNRLEARIMLNLSGLCYEL